MPRIRLALIAAAVGLLIAGCSSSHKTTTLPPAAPPAVITPSASAPAAGAPAASPPASAAAAVSAGLSGTWSGQYGGAYQGTFTLTWRQSGSNLSGSIKLSAPALTLPIHGTVQGGAIRFGTVGSVGITYSGSVSGNSMSGSYQVHGGNGGGPWSAGKA